MPIIPGYLLLHSHQQYIKIQLQFLEKIWLGRDFIKSQAICYRKLSGTKLSKAFISFYQI